MPPYRLRRAPQKRIGQMAQSKVAELEGKELADDYIRTAGVPKGRWSDTWGIFKQNFMKLVIINVLVLLFAVPAIAIVYFGESYLSQLCSLYPGAAGEYPYFTSTVGLYERLTLSVDLMFYSLLIAAGLVASVGISGAVYSVKKLINTHGQFTLKGFFHGVRVCYLNTALPVTLCLIFYFACVTISDWAALRIAEGYGAAGPITAKVFIIIAAVIVAVACMWFLAVGCSYKVKFRYLVKNSMVLLVGTVIQTIFMLGFALIPVWIYLIGNSVQLFKIIAYIIFIVFGFSFIILCWMAFTQWAFDLFITPAVMNEKEAKRAMMTPKQLEAEKEEEEKQIARELLAAGKSELIGRPIMPIGGEISVPPIGVTYSRADINRAAGDRAKLDESLNGYYEQHKNDTRYAEYNKLFAEREKALQSPSKKGKKKKISQDNLLG